MDSRASRERRDDLIVLTYVWSDVSILARIKQSLKKGGLIVVEAFGKGAVKGPNAAGLDSIELVALFRDGYQILRNDAVDDIADWGSHRTKLVRFVAQKR